MSRNPLDPRPDDVERMSDFGERRTHNVESLKDRLDDVTSKAKLKAEQWRE